MLRLSFELRSYFEEDRFDMSRYQVFRTCSSPILVRANRLLLVAVVEMICCTFRAAAIGPASIFGMALVHGCRGARSSSPKSVDRIGIRRVAAVLPWIVCACRRDLAVNNQVNWPGRRIGATNHQWRKADRLTSVRGGKRTVF